MADDRETTYNDLKQMLLTEMEDNKEDILAEEDPEERVLEMARDNVPYDNYSLLTVVQSNMGLGCEDVEEGDGDVFSALQRIIAEELYEVGYERLACWRAACL